MCYNHTMHGPIYFMFYANLKFHYICIFILLINNIIKIKYLKINPVNLLSLLTLLIHFNITGPLLYYLSLSFTISIIYSIIDY